jgi:hypothetical protein
MQISQFGRDQNAKYMDRTRDEGRDAKTYWSMMEHKVLFR